jgi:hypothetical protein
MVGVVGGATDVELDHLHLRIRQISRYPRGVHDHPVLPSIGCFAPTAPQNAMCAPGRVHISDDPG